MEARKTNMQRETQARVDCKDVKVSSIVIFLLDVCSFDSVARPFALSRFCQLYSHLKMCPGK
jgi:hypothetical protein